MRINFEAKIGARRKGRKEEEERENKNRESFTNATENGYKQGLNRLKI